MRRYSVHTCVCLHHCNPSTNGALAAEKQVWHQLRGCFRLTSARIGNWDGSVWQLGFVEARDDEVGLGRGDSVGEQRRDVIGAS